MIPLLSKRHPLRLFLQLLLRRLFLFRTLTRPARAQIYTTVPDLITVLDSQNGAALGTPDYRYGLRVTVMALAGHPLWVANFDVPSPLVPAQNWAGKGWSIWQFTSSGRVKGIDGAVDKNRLARGFGKIKVR